jgi:D-alanyl-D-alanine carboxypeptidase
MLDRARTRLGASVKVFLLFAVIFGLWGADAAARTSRHHHARGHRHALPAGLTDPAKDAALIIDGVSGKVLYSRNANAERHPASLTKMMTLYLLFEALKKGQVTLSTEIPISAHAAAQKPTKLYLPAGDSIPVDTAIYAIVVRSANDIAVAIAEALGGTESHFATMMNEKARQLGMRDTFYHNASGLPDPLQISTASDLAILARHLAYDFPQYFHYFSAPGFSFRGVNYVTHDNLIGHYDGADGIKTGYTSGSGFNLVSSVVRGRTHIIGVVMGGRTARRRDREMMNLLDSTFARVEDNPTLVASAKVPWQALAQNTPPVVAGFDLSPPTARPAPPIRVADATDAEDEDAAETQSDSDEDVEDNEIAAAPPPVPTPLPTAAAPPPAAAPPALAKSQTPAPKPRPVFLAAYEPPKPALRPQSGEGDYGDDADVATPKLGAQSWTIQIGAFANPDLARAQLASYAERSMDILGQAARIVVPFKAVDGQTLFRARFGPFVEREAREVCARLTQRGQTCFAALATR